MTLSSLSGSLAKQLIIWGPIAVGVIHQILMNFFDKPAVYIFVPPTWLYPLVSLAWQWWILLTLATAGLTIVSLTGKSRRNAARLGVPVYLYLLYLLIIVKPEF
ncbi:MAG: hypothetical protein D6784_12935 [Chloroflexi bacterium]|nr:MAG: hypothetical protein D6784_12935 [Chloroflexota bacterium]